MKKAAALALSLILALSLTACAGNPPDGGDPNDFDGDFTLTAEILEIGDGWYLVKPVEGSWELSSADQIRVPIEHLTVPAEPKVGDLLEIVYTGGIQESYPARLTGVESITLLQAEEETIYKTPPALTLLYGEQTSVEAMQGTFTWNFPNEDGTMSCLCADALHPTAARDLMPTITLFQSTLSHIHPLEVCLKFESVPDSVSVRCWTLDQTVDQGEAMEIFPFDGGPGDPQFTFLMKEASCVYEVTATWDDSHRCFGTGTYGFQTFHGGLAQPMVE